MSPAKEPMPEWLVAHLKACGHLDLDGVSRAARTGFCKGCGLVVVRGLDADRIAVLATVDPVPLTGLGEVLALLAGKATWELRWVAGRARYELDPRDQWRIAAVGAELVHTVAAHVCGTVAPAGTSRPGSSPRPPAPRRVDDDAECPF